MVSGFVTSPYDQPRISSGEAIFSWMKSKSLRPRLAGTREIDHALFSGFRMEAAKLDSWPPRAGRWAKRRICPVPGGGRRPAAVPPSITPRGRA